MSMTRESDRRCQFWTVPKLRLGNTHHIFQEHLMTRITIRHWKRHADDLVTSAGKGAGTCTWWTIAVIVFTANPSSFIRKFFYMRKLPPRRTIWKQIAITYGDDLALGLCIKSSLLGSVLLHEDCVLKLCSMLWISRFQTSNGSTMLILTSSMTYIRSPID